MADWHTKLKPFVTKELDLAILRLQQPGLAPDKTEFLRGQIQAFRMVLDTAQEKPKPQQGA